MGTAQPPLPLQEFLALQPLSPEPQPPRPLQSFLPAQSCLAVVAQPPLPSQEFLPAQPLSPDLHPPFPAHLLKPLQACRSAIAAGVLSAGFVAGALGEALLAVDSSAVQPVLAPIRRPETAAARMLDVDFFMSFSGIRVESRGEGVAGEQSICRPVLEPVADTSGIFSCELDGRAKGFASMQLGEDQMG